MENCKCERDIVKNNYQESDWDNPLFVQNSLSSLALGCVVVHCSDHNLSWHETRINNIYTSRTSNKKGRMVRMHFFSKMPAHGFSFESLFSSPKKCHKSSVKSHFHSFKPFSKLKTFAPGNLWERKMSQRTESMADLATLCYWVVTFLLVYSTIGLQSMSVTADVTRKNEDLSLNHQRNLLAKRLKFYQIILGKFSTNTDKNYDVKV